MRIKQPRARLQPAQNPQNTEARAPCAHCRDAHAVARSCLHTETRAHITAAACRFRSAAVDLVNIQLNIQLGIRTRSERAWRARDRPHVAPLAATQAFAPE